MVENVLAAGEQWEAGERILDMGRIMDLRVPKPMAMADCCSDMCFLE